MVFFSFFPLRFVNISGEVGRPRGGVKGAVARILGYIVVIRRVLRSNGDLGAGGGVASEIAGNRRPPPGMYIGNKVSLRIQNVASGQRGIKTGRILRQALKIFWGEELPLKDADRVTVSTVFMTPRLRKRRRGGFQATFGIRASIHYYSRMEVNAEQYAGWESGRRSIARIAKAVRDKYVALNKDAVLRACSEVWACENTGIGMDILCNLINRLQPARGKEEIFDELCTYQAASPKRFFGSNDREKFNQYLLRYPPKRASYAGASTGPDVRGKEETAQGSSPNSDKKTTMIKRNRLTRKKKQTPVSKLCNREGEASLEEEIPDLTGIICMRELAETPDGQGVGGNYPAKFVMDKPVTGLSEYGKMMVSLAARRTRCPQISPPAPGTALSDFSHRSGC